MATLRALRFQVRLNNGAVLHVVPEMQYRDIFAARDWVLHVIPPQVVDDAMLQQCIGPAAAGLHALCMQQVHVKEVAQFGVMPKKPDISIIVPLYKRLEFIKLQFAVMANDPDIKRCELVYVLDSPEQEQEVRIVLKELSLLYGLPSTLLVMSHNSGYAAATHAGTMHARGRYIVLLNSDVVPKTKGWAHAMMRYYKQHPQVGALGVKLLYEDGSLQHAGMYFEKVTARFWRNQHYFQGYPGAYAAAAHSRAVPAVTGACLMMSAERYRAIGGISTQYVVGDFEDSDLCLRCHKHGWETHYFSGAELYHFERQSVPASPSYQSGLAWRYNAMLHHRQWDKVIAAMAQPEERGTHADIA